MGDEINSLNLAEFDIQALEERLELGHLLPILMTDNTCGTQTCGTNSCGSQVCGSQACSTMTCTHNLCERELPPQ